VEDGVAKLYIGLPTEAIATVLNEMSQDMDFRLTVAVNIPQPLNGRFTPAQQLVAEEMLIQSVDAYLIREQLFTLSNENPDEEGLVFPEAATLNGQTWDLPTPVLGIATRPKWSAPTPPELLSEGEEDWMLGQSPDGLRLGGRQVQVLGADDSAAEWLSRLVLTRLTRKQSNLVVIDGRGDLVPRLLSNPSIARLRSAKQVTYLDVNVAGQGGVNPLASGPEEDLEQIVTRWCWWFNGMGVTGRSLDLLPKAIEAGVTDLPAMQHWLKSQNGANFAAAASFRAVIDQLMRNPVVYRWLTLYPVALRTALENEVLFISCPYRGSWPRFQAKAIRAVLALISRSGTDLVLHRTPIEERDLDRAKALRIVNTSNDPTRLHRNDATVFTHHDGEKKIEGEVTAVLQRPPQNTLTEGMSLAMMIEHAQCLRPGEALVVRDSFIGFGVLGVGFG
jgi:hypothetical protein